MRYCKQCVLPDSRPNLSLDADGICNACRAVATKPNIDWQQRGEKFVEVIRNAKRRSTGYDCLIPASGGKDSHWQVVTCLEHGLNPLVVTWKTPARTPIGQKNLENMISLGVDHIDYQINPKVESQFMLRAFEKYGSTAIPMHMALFSIPPTIAVRFNIPLIIWGENSAFEYGSKREEDTGFRLDGNWLSTYGVTHGTIAKDWINEGFTSTEMKPYYGPSDEELEKAGVNAVFLGYYMQWDPIMTKEVAEAHGFISDVGGARTGFYDFADIDDDFISIHHWLKWYKFGFTRLFDNLSLEIRAGRMCRENAVDIIAKAGPQTPYADIEKFCGFTGISVRRFFEIAETFRNPEIWKQHNGQWKIDGFLVPEWDMI